MKKLLCIFLLFSFALKPSAQIALDKYAHATTCSLIGFATHEILQHKVSDKKLFTLTFAVPILCGSFKEGYDYLKGKPFSLGDLKADFIGALAVTVFCKIVYNFTHKPKGQLFFFGTTDKERLERNKNKIDISNL